MQNLQKIFKRNILNKSCSHLLSQAEVFSFLLTKCGGRSLSLTPLALAWCWRRCSCRGRGGARSVSVPWVQVQEQVQVQE